MSGADFIQFCLRLYSSPGVRPACLALQDRRGLDVNCLLLAVWAARAGLRLSSSAWRHLQAIASPIREGAVEPIRRLRRAISANESLAQELRAPLKRLLLYAELRAEQAEERQLFDAARRLATPAPYTPRLLEENLEAYCGRPPELDSFLTAVRATLDQRDHLL
jgi:uncharacterized protein (TIGR02444 family)